MLKAKDTPLNASMWPPSDPVLTQHVQIPANRIVDHIIMTGKDLYTDEILLANHFRTLYLALQRKHRLV